MRSASAPGWLLPVALIAGFVSLAYILPPYLLREGALVACLIIVVVALIAQLAGARQASSVSTRSGLDLVLIAVVSLGLSTIYWYRAALGVSGWDHIGFEIVITLAWWLPAAAHAALYRHPGQTWYGRRRFFLRLAVAALAALPAIPIQNLLHEQRSVRAEIAGLPAAIESLAERLLPDGAGFEYQFEQGVLYLNAAWPEWAETGHYRPLDWLHALAGDAGAMRLGGADRLVERVNVERVHLRVTRDGRLIAHMDWPEPGLRRGEQALVIDHEAAGLAAFPTQDDLDEVLGLVPDAFRTGKLCAEGADGVIRIGRCEGEPDPTTDDDASELERDWQAVNLVVRELSRLFPDVTAFEVTLAGQELRVRRDDISPSFDARRKISAPESPARNREKSARTTARPRSKQQIDCRQQPVAMRPQLR